ncbi:hypothetical protein [Bhargavaea cecembensis]|uniref:hypothetical protein n=1 Tax=Bhargavaea cecembensis TaxID=394098 RepID=UPI0012E8EDFE|nr:hypothetical protein [Bhargavaea cecembensis]
MKRILHGWLIAAALVSSACSDPEVTSFTEVNQVPGDVWELVKPDQALQLLSSKDQSYIVFESEQAVAADYEIKDNTVIIQLDESGETQEVPETHVYELQTDAKRDTIEVRVNGKQRAFDNVTGF